MKSKNTFKNRLHELCKDPIAAAMVMQSLQMFTDEVIKKEPSLLKEEKELKKAGKRPLIPIELWIQKARELKEIL